MCSAKVILKVLICIFIIVILWPQYAFSASYNSKRTQVELAGKALFPEKEHDEWLEVQLNPSIEAIEKIKSTVNSFYILKYESWYRLILLDFGFLFDKTDSKAWDDYAYERGLLNLYLVGWRCNYTYLRLYEYNPEFRKVDIKGQKASVVVWPRARIALQDDPPSNGPWATQEVELVYKSGKWLIERLINEDLYYAMYPRGSDFDELALTLPDKIIMAIELEGGTRNVKEELANEIIGFYRLDKQDKVFDISFCEIERILMCTIDNNDEKIKLYPIWKKNLQFWMMPRNGQVFDFKFVEDATGKIRTCTISTMGKKYTGRKTSGANLINKIAENFQQ